LPLERRAPPAGSGLTFSSLLSAPSTPCPSVTPSSDYNAAIQAFFSSFKCYDEAGDPRRFTLLKYLVLASMLHASTIDPFDSQVRARRLGFPCSYHTSERSHPPSRLLPAHPCPSFSGGQALQGGAGGGGHAQPHPRLPESRRESLRDHLEGVGLPPPLRPASALSTTSDSPTFLSPDTPTGTDQGHFCPGPHRSASNYDPHTGTHQTIMRLLDR